MNDKIAITKASDAYKKLLKQYSDRNWRINHLYFVADEDGNKVRYSRRPAQIMYAENQWALDIIVKSRQLGFSTEIAIEITDLCVFTKNQAAGIIDFKLEDAKKKLQKIKYAYEGLPANIREAVRLLKDNEDELRFSNGSSVVVGTSHRGGTLQYLHVSEFGKIAAEKPDVANEIITGAFNTISPGNVIKVESTAHGTSGKFYDLVRVAEALQKEKRALSPLDFKLHFFGWYLDPKYRVQSSLVQIPLELQEYFDTLRTKYGVVLDADQCAWYAQKFKQLGKDDMHSEFPSVMDECFYNSLEGTFFKPQLSKAREERRIGYNIPHDPMRRVNTFWDKGMNEKTDQNAIIFHQTDGVRHRLIHYYENAGEGIQHYAQKVQEIGRDRGFLFGTHYGPHDLDARQYIDNAKTIREVALDLGIKFEIVPRVLDKQDAIEAARAMLGLTWIDAEHCERLVECLDNYRKVYNKTLAQWTNTPLHNWASNCFTGDTKILTRFGLQRISDLPISGEVLTQCGWKPYRNPRMTQSNAQLVEVVFSDGLSVKCTPDHLFLTASGWRSAESLRPGSLIQSCLTQSRNILAESSTVSRPRMAITAMARFFIARFGRGLLGQFPAGAISTIAMKSEPVTGSKTSNVFRRVNIWLLRGGLASPKAAYMASTISRASGPLHGINQTRAGYGTNEQPSGRKPTRYGSVRIVTAFTAMRSLIASFVRTVAHSFIAPKSAGMLSITSVKRLEQRADVYCVTVPETASFSLSNGAIVHNCADALMTGAVGLKPDKVPSAARYGQKGERRGSHWSS